MGLFLSDAPAEVAVVGTPGIRQRLTSAVRTLGLPVRVPAPNPADTQTIGASFYCIDSAVLGRGARHRPAVIVCTSGRVARQVGVVPISTSDLAPGRLLRAKLDADLQVNGGVLQRLVPTIPVLLMSGFLRHPLAFTSRRDLCSFLDVSRTRAQALLRRLGCGCPAHFVTRCRAESWVLLVRIGVRRGIAEQYLGIRRRDNFARSCARAGVPVPWERAGSPPLWRSYGGHLVHSEGNPIVRSLSRTAPSTHSL